MISNQLKVFLQSLAENDNKIDILLGIIVEVCCEYDSTIVKH